MNLIRISEVPKLRMHPEEAVDVDKGFVALRHGDADTETPEHGDASAWAKNSDPSKRARCPS